MSKKLNTNSITNELENSSFFPSAARSAQDGEREVPPQAASPAPVAVLPEAPATTTTPVPEGRPRNAVRKATSTKETTRGYVRRTFDIFEDQLQYLTRASLEDRLAGGEGSMNAMVRQAIDAFIAKRKSK
jgi:hypothetical protein